MSFQYRPCRGIVDDDKVRKNHLTLPSPQGEGRGDEVLLVSLKNTVVPSIFTRPSSKFIHAGALLMITKLVIKHPR
jgi:hypothetical protein